MMWVRWLLISLLTGIVCMVVSAQGSSDAVWRRISSADGLVGDHVMLVSQMPQGSMLIVTHRTVNIYDGGRFAIIPRSEASTIPLPHYRGSYRACIDADGILWIKEWGRLWCVDMTNMRLVPDVGTLLAALAGDDEGASRADITDIFFDHDHRLWLLFGDGRLLDTHRHQWYDLDTLADAVADIAVHDHRLLLFLGRGGVVTFDRDSHTCDHPAVCPDRMPQDVWDMNILTTDGGDVVYLVYSGHPSCVMMYDARSAEWTELARSDMVLYGAYVLDAHHIGISTRHGILELETATGQSEPSATMPPYTLGRAATMPAAITTTCPSRFYSSFLTAEGEFSDIACNAICRDHQGGIWIGTDALGLLYTHSHHHKFHTAPDYASLGITDDEAQRLHQRLIDLYDANKQQDQDLLRLSQGEVWHATHDGIIIDRGGVHVRLTTADGLPANHIISLTADPYGHVWAATNNGIAEIRRGSAGSYVVSKYGIDDGVPHWGFFYSSSLLLYDGRIALQAQQGWMAFHPDSVHRQVGGMHTPRLVGISINGTDTVAPSSRLRLDYRSGNVSLFFSVFDYAFPEQVGYQWRVNGGAWEHGAPFTDTHGLLRLDFIQLSPGQYNIEVRASADGITYTSPSAQFRLVVSPPWWRTWWAYTLYVVLTLAAAVAIVATYVMSQKRRLEWRRKEEVLQLQIRHLMEQAIPAPPPSDEADDEPQPAEAANDATTTGDPAAAEFIQRVVALIEQHLGEDYTVEQLASDLCMERTGLYKRLTSVINQSPQRFIRTVRVRRAQELLTTTSLPIADICYMVGFSSPSYMSRCFLEDLGMKPSQWRSAHTK